MRGIIFLLAPIALAALAARGEGLAAFDGRCIPAGCVAPPSNIPDILGRRALPAGRLARLGATPDLHHGLLASQPSQAPLAGLFNEQQGPVANYRGYAHADCGPANSPAVRVIALQGLVPDGVPRTPPRPSIDIVIYAGLDKAVGQPFTVAPKAAEGGAVVSSCPVVGDCAPAGNGTVSLTSRAEDGTLVGEFRAKWAIGAPRAGRFTVPWRDANTKCG